MIRVFVNSFPRESRVSIVSCFYLDKNRDIAPWNGARKLHLSAERRDNGGSINDIVLETSSQAKWAADAFSELPPQGDLVSLGLGGYSPIGLLQTGMEWLHVSAGLPWWAAIIVSSLALRVTLLPLAVKLQANAVKMNNIRPETDKIMQKMKEYQQMGNADMAAREGAKLMMLYQKHNCNPLKMMVMPFLQLPIFVSFFVSIRRMAQAPVESMKEGGVLWFTDLTMPDPFYILPFVSCFTFIANIELGGETGVTNPQVEKMKFFFRIMAILLIPLTATFPSGLFMYWLTSSLFSMGQILMLKVPAVRSVLGIPAMVKHPQSEGETKAKGGAIRALKESYKQSSLISEARHKENELKRVYNKQLADKSPKLFNQPPHKRTTPK